MLGHMINVLRNKDRNCSRCGTPLSPNSGECPKCFYTDEDEFLRERGRYRTREYLKERNRGFLFLGTVALTIVVLTIIFGWILG